MNQPQSSWNLSLLFASNNDPKIMKLRQLAIKKIDEFVANWKNEKSHLTNPEKMLEALTELEELGHSDLLAREMLYVWLKKSLKSDDESVTAVYNKTHEAILEQENKLTFFNLEIGKIPEEMQKTMLNSETLKKFHPYLKEVFEQAKHKLTEQEENLLSQVQKTSFDNWSQMVDTEITTSKKMALNEHGVKKFHTFEELMTNTESDRAEVRDLAAKAINEILKQKSKMATNEMNSILEFYRTVIKLRKFDRADKKRLLADRINHEAVDALCEAINNNLDISHRFYKLKAKALGLDKLEYYERRVNPKTELPEYSFEDSIEITDRVFKNLDPQFSEILQQMLKNGQIDVYPAKGKSGGAFCIGYGRQNPVFVLLNFTKKLTDVTTIAHEMGHAINHVLMQKTESNLYYDTPTSITEVPSTFFEDFIIDDLLKTSTTETQKALLFKKLDGDISSIYRQVSAYNFEREMHEEAEKQGYLSTKVLGDMFIKHMKSYMGEAVNFGKGSENWWVYWSHFRNPFYAYSYAVGTLISKALQARVIENPSYISQVKKIFSTGLSKTPAEIYNEVGIDINSPDFWNDGLQQVRAQLDKLEKMYEM